MSLDQADYAAFNAPASRRNAPPAWMTPRASRSCGRRHHTQPEWLLTLEEQAGSSKEAASREGRS